MKLKAFACAIIVTLISITASAEQVRVYYDQSSLFAETKVRAFADFLASELPKAVPNFRGNVIVISEPFAGRYTVQLFNAFSPQDSDMRRQILKAEVETRIGKTWILSCAAFIEEGNIALARNANNLPALMAELMAIQAKYSK